MFLTRFLHRSSAALLALALCAGTSSAQSLSDSETSHRFPAEGIPILDCKPPAPAPEDSCVVRVPPSQQRGKLTRKSIGDREANFEFVRAGSSLFPDGLELSATVLMIDRTPTYNESSGARRINTWPQEREHIKRLAGALPADEMVAVYTFDDELQRLVDFTKDRNRVMDAIDNIALQGLNTRITTSTQDIVDVLAQRKDLLLKNIVVITDGREEGASDTTALARAAEAAGVTVSALAMVWERPGASIISADLDYIRELTTKGLGASQTVRLRGGKAAEEVDSFIDDFTSSVGGSGLIVPVGEPAPAEITVPLKVPVAGVVGSFDTQRITATFTPAAAAEDPAVEEDEPPAEPENWMNKEIFGYKAIYVYGIVGVLAALLLILLLVLMRRPEERPSPAEGDLDLDEDDLDLDGDDDHTMLVGGKSGAAAVETPIAYLVRKDTGDRLPISKAKTGIGRSNDNRVVINDPSVSRVHAQLYLNREGGFSLTDLDSLNGTFVNEKKIKGTQQVKAGDTLGFGTIRANIIKA